MLGGGEYPWAYFVLLRLWEAGTRVLLARTQDWALETTAMGRDVMTMRVFATLLAATAVFLAGAACATASSTEGESSESDSFWDRTVGGVTDGPDSHIELTEYVSEDTGWRTEPAYGLRPDDFVVLPYANEFLARARLGWIVYNADAVECEPYRWDSDTASAQLATPPRGVVGTAGGYDDDVRVIYGKDETRYICRVSSDKMIGFGVPRYLADHVVDALDSYARELRRTNAAQEDKEAQLIGRWPSTASILHVE